MSQPSNSKSTGVDFRFSPLVTLNWISGWVDVMDVMEVNGLRPSWYQIDDSSPFPRFPDFLIGSCLKKKVQLFNEACVAKSTG